METPTAPPGTERCLSFPLKQQKKVNVKPDTEPPSKKQPGRIQWLRQRAGEASVQWKVGAPRPPGGCSPPALQGERGKLGRASGKAALSRIPQRPKFPLASRSSGLKFRAFLPTSQRQRQARPSSAQHLGVLVLGAPAGPPCCDTPRSRGAALGVGVWVWMWGGMWGGIWVGIWVGMWGGMWNPRGTAREGLHAAPSPQQKRPRGGPGVALPSRRG